MSGRSRDYLLAVKGYKAVRHRQELRLAPLTIISGVNSSGKSSFMQPFLLMKQTLDSAFDPGPLLLYGPNVKVTDHAQIFSRGKSRTDAVKEFTVGLASGRSVRQVTFAATSTGELRIKSDVAISGGEKVEIADPLTPAQRKHLRQLFGERAETYREAFARRGDETEISWRPDVTRNRCFLEIAITLEMGEDHYSLPVPGWQAEDDEWVRLLRGIIHVPGLRGNPERSYQRSATGATYPGTFETYVASLIYEWSERDMARLARLASDLERLGLTWKVQARKLNDASIELLVGRMPHAQQGGAHDLVSVADVGFGVSQTLPVLVALHAARRGQVVYIEQPEIHLHPRAQLGLAHAFVAATKRGVTVVAETHSSLLIRGVQTEVAKGTLSARNLSMNWFSRDAETGAQQVTVAELDNKGRFGDWPLDFDDISHEADWKYLDAIGDDL